MQIKDGNRKTGQGRIVCPFYEEIDAIIGTWAASAPLTLLESSGIANDKLDGKLIQQDDNPELNIDIYVKNIKNDTVFHQKIWPFYCIMKIVWPKFIACIYHKQE